MEIYNLNKEEMGYEYPLEQTKENLFRISKSEHDKIFVAVMAGEVVGYVHVNTYLTTYTPHLKNIMGIAVSKHCKRKGVGRALLNKIEEWAKETGAEGVRLVSGLERTDAHAFYRSCDYSGDKTQLNLRKMLY